MDKMFCISDAILFLLINIFSQNKINNISRYNRYVYNICFFLSSFHRSGLYKDLSIKQINFPRVEKKEKEERKHKRKSRMILNNFFRFILKSKQTYWLRKFKAKENMKWRQRLILFCDNFVFSSQIDRMLATDAIGKCL